MALQIVKPSANRYCKALIFAPGGAGKTVLAGTAALDKRCTPALVLDFEGGSESLSGLDIDIGPIKSWQDYNEAYELLASGDSGYRSVIIDSISETHKFALLDILRKEGPNRKDPELLEQRDYGKATVQMRRLLREFRDLPMHVFFISHAKELEVPREGRVRIPDLAGQMAEEVSGLMSVCGYLAQFEEDGETHRTLLLHSFPKFRIKARTPWDVTVPEELIDPTVTSLMDSLGYGEPQGDLSAQVKGSSRGKQKEDVVPEGDAVESEDKVPGTSDNNEEEEEEQEEQTLESLTLSDLKEVASEREVDLGAAKTKKQIIAVLREEAALREDENNDERGQ